MGKSESHVRVEKAKYHESGSLDDYEAWMVFVYYTATLGSK